MVERLLTVLVLSVDHCARLDEHLHALELLLHRRPHECRLTALRVGLQRALLVNERLQEYVVAGLHGAKQRRLSVKILLVDLRPVGDEELADLVAAELRRQEQRRLAGLCHQVDLCLLSHQTPHGGDVALCASPHEARLVIVVELVHLGTLLDEKLAHLPVAVRSGLHKSALTLLCGVVGRNTILSDQHVDNLEMTSQARPHQGVPLLIVLEVDGRPLVEQELHNVGFTLLRRLHQRSDAFIVLRIQQALLLVLRCDASVAAASTQWSALLLLPHLGLDQILDDFEVALLACLHQRCLSAVVFGRNPCALLH
mmetsp:Transcript_44241/g.96246  ORF Transcript_44241/g.96246 Transcript_44241/m.96246 type:complete len:312 (+) Transcript_44241:266-1201(+)